MVNNQRLLVSVFDAQEAREAIAGGARVIDCEDPSGALGDISPDKVMDIADAVLGYKRSLDLQISTNIGENQLLFKSDDHGRAVQRFPGEIAGKAAQAGLGVAAAMGTELHPVNIVKVGLDGMPRSIALETLKEIVATLNRSALFSRSQVVAVFFAQNLQLWKQRRDDTAVIRDLMLAREYSVDPRGDIDVNGRFGSDPKALSALKDKLGEDRALFDGAGSLVPGVKVRLTQLNPREPLGLPDDPVQYLRAVADLAAEGGADGLMIDTRIHSKAMKVCSLTAEIAPQASDQLALTGIHTLEDFGDCARYCHDRGIEFWAAGSLQPKQAQALWALKDEQGCTLIDAMAVRGGASAVRRPADFKRGGGGVTAASDTSRGAKRIYRDLVAAYTPPQSEKE